MDYVNLQEVNNKREEKVWISLFGDGCFPMVIEASFLQ